MKTVTCTRILPIVTGLLLAAFLQPSTLYAQKQIKDTSVANLLTYYSVKEYSSFIPELRDTISLQLENFSLPEALFHIAQEANLEIAFDPGIFEEGGLVTINNRNIQVADALAHALQNTEYESVITQNKELLLKKKEVPQDVEEVVEIELTGQVRDADTGEPLVGVTVFLIGTNTGTTTDGNGRFSLTVPDDAQTLAFSYVGYERQEITIDGQIEFNIEMETDVAMLDDLVVVGYGTQQRAEVTGSVVSISAEIIARTPVSSFENALQGRLAGVNVAESTGEPGAAPQILIRGMGSISAGTGPLYVVDGVPISQNLDQQDQLASQRSSFQPPRANPLATINPGDIESIEVLKDASAAAIYGSRGSNGVILITTKRGDKNSPPQVNFRSYIGAQTAFNVPELMNAEEVIAYTKDARNNTYLRERSPTDPSSPTYNPLYNPDTNAGRAANGAIARHLIPEAYVNWDGTDTDWLALIMDTSVLQNYDLSVSGGADNFTYFVGGGFMDQTGIIEGSGFNRYSINMNLSANLTDRLDLSLGLNTAFAEHDRKPANAPYFGTPPGIIYSAMTQSPVIDPFNPDGTYRQLDGSHNELGGNMTTTNHPLAIRDYIDETIKNNRIFGNLTATYAVRENLAFKSMVGYDIDNYQRSFFQGTQLYYRGGNPRSFGQASSAQSFNWLWENTLNYQLVIGEDHRINAIAGYTVQKQNDERSRVVAQNFPDDQVKTVNGGQITGGNQTIQEWSLVSYLARVNYVLANRYLLTATIRSDRSSRFGIDNQTGVFPSVSLGWQFTNEPFMSDFEFFSQLKPRVSYGVTGNFQIPNYGSIGLLTGSNYVFSDQIVPGVIPNTLGNEELTWETTHQFNIGLDFAMLEDRIYGSFDYYVSNTTDLLLEVNIPAITGFTNALTNIGEVENKGFEVQVTSRNVVGDFNWATDLNFAKNTNEVIKLGHEGDPILVSGAAGIRHITQIGSPIGSYYGYKVVGIFQTQQEIDSAPIDQEGKPTPGDFMFADINNDGVINADDRTILGSYHPAYTWGITNRFNWKNIDFSFFIQGVEGREILNLTARHLKNGEANFNSYAVLNDRWISTEQPGNGEHPKAERRSGGNNNRPSSYQVEDASYIKLKNITLGYNLPIQLIDSFARSVRVYGAVTNVAIWTDYIGFNPEVNLQAGNALTPGEDYGAYPLSRAFQFGIDVSF